MKPHQTKMTVHVDADDYHKFTYKMHNGQISQTIRKFIRAINSMTTPEEVREFKLWVYGDDTLTLKQPKEE